MFGLFVPTNWAISGKFCRQKQKKKTGHEIEIVLLTLGHRTAESSFTMLILCVTVFAYLSALIGTVASLCADS